MEEFKSEPTHATLTLEQENQFIYMPLDVKIVDLNEEVGHLVFILEIIMQQLSHVFSCIYIQISIS